MKVIVYTRPRIKTFFHELSEKIMCFKNITYMSDHKGEEEICIMDYYYKAKEDIMSGAALQHSQFDFERILNRCRYLRTLNTNEAYITAKSMTLAIERIVEKYEPDVIFGMVMDSYVLDIIDQVMRLRNSQYIGFLNNMINGYSRLTSRGELIQLNTPDEIMLEEALKELRRDNYVPNMQKDFMWNTSPSAMFFTKYLKEKIKIIYYFLKKKMDKDPDNFYYNTVSSKDCMSCRKIDQIFFRRFENNNWINIIQNAKAQGRIIVYMPLQFYPECSIDYWGTNNKFSNFYNVVEKLCSNPYKKILILVKEHPSAMGLRKSKFYEQFSKNENIVLTPFDVSSNTVIHQADIVLTWTGSVGVEAIMRNKPLVTFGEAYYDPGYGICRLNSESQLSNIENIILEFYNNDFNNENNLKNDIVALMLKGLIPGYIFPLDYKTKKNPLNSSEIIKLSAGINEFIVKLKKNGSYPVKSGCI